MHLLRKLPLELLKTVTSRFLTLLIFVSPTVYIVLNKYAGHSQVSMLKNIDNIIV